MNRTYSYLFVSMLCCATPYITYCSLEMMYAFIAGGIAHSIATEQNQPPLELKNIARQSLRSALSQGQSPAIRISAESKILLSPEYAGALYNAFMRQSIDNFINTLISGGALCSNNENLVLATITLKNHLPKSTHMLNSSELYTHISAEKLHQAYTLWQQSANLANTAHKANICYLVIKNFLKVFQVAAPTI